MSSIGLGNNKKGSRVADSSMMTRNIRQTVNSFTATSELSQLGNLGIPTFRIPAAQTVQTVYKSMTPADINSFNSADQASKNIRT
jgi:hypothetical protein